MSYNYHPDARHEASASLAYYAAINQQLGADFLAQLENAIARIVSAPKPGPNIWPAQGVACCIVSLTE